jgi:hypothetical protein
MSAVSVCPAATADWEIRCQMACASTPVAQAVMANARRSGSVHGMTHNTVKRSWTAVRRAAAGPAAGCGIRIGRAVHRADRGEGEGD